MSIYSRESYFPKSVITEFVVEMERVEARLLKISEKRASFLDWLHSHISITFLESNAFFHSFLILTLAAIMITVFAQLRALKLIAFHPILMSIGTIFFIAEGIVAQTNHTFVDVFGPIMQHSKKIKIRVIHQNLNAMGGVFIGMGLLFMFAHKFMKEESIFPHTPHEIFGWVTLLALVVQVVIGGQKLQTIDTKGIAKPFKWHGDAGLVVWDLLCLTTLLGMLEFFQFNISNIFVECCVFMVWYVVHLQMMVKKKASDTDPLAGDTHELQPMLPSTTAEEMVESGAK